VAIELHVRHRLVRALERDAWVVVAEQARAQRFVQE
jgi:hypothetical protein